MFHLIEDQNDLKILDEELIKLDFLAVDTEFYRKGKQDIKLSLIQVNNSEEIFIIDCIKLGTYKDNCKFLFSEKVTKIFHSLREDLEAILSWTKCKLVNVYDTQLANAFLGGSFSIGYQDLVKEKFEILIDKDETRSNWTKRPLRDSQLKYAANDVQFLIDLYIDQKEDLSRNGKIDWLYEEILFEINKILSNEDLLSLPRIHISKEEERELLIEFNNIVISNSGKYNINPTIMLSKKNQKDLLRKCFYYGFNSTMKDFQVWRKEILFDDLRLLFKDCPE